MRASFAFPGYRRSLQLSALLISAGLSLACGGGDSTAPKPLPEIASVTPTSGPLAGGTSLTITGEHFVGVSSVTVGGVALTQLVVVSESQITGVSPAGASSGPKDVVVIAANGSGTCTECFSYNPALSISSVNPHNGALTGGTSLTITGMNFVNVTTVSIGGVAATGFVVNSPTSMVAQTPPGSSSGARDVVVGSSSHGSATCTGCFTYNPPATVVSVTPNNGPLAGGTAIVINGTNFIDVASVTIGGVALVNRTIVSTTQITGSVPAGAAVGPRDVVVGTANHGIATCAGCYTYNPAMSVTTVAPATGVLTGGTAVTITGTNFANVTGVTIGGAALTNMIVVSATTITGVTPAGSSAGARDVMVTSSSHGVASCVGCFTYNPNTTVSGVSPSSGPVTGGTAITITGTNFVGVTAVTVGGTPLVNTNVVSSTQITGLTPAGSNNGTIVVTTAAHGSAICAGCFTYDPPISISSVSPASGRLSGNTSIIITGSSFHNVTAVTIGGVAMQNVVVVSPTQIQGNTPAGTSAGSRDVIVSSSTHGTATCTGCYTYEPPANWAFLTANNVHTCGITTGGKAYCWGSGGNGRLGTGSNSDSNVPRALTNGMTFVTLAAGGHITCGLTAGGTAYCWGDNTFGQLGDGTTTERGTPVAVAGGLTFAALAPALSHTCGLTTSGVAYCWGRNNRGQLGDGTTIDRTSPVAVGGSVFAQLSAGTEHTCGRTAAGTALCWGYNGSGQLGDGSYTSSTTPVTVAGGIAFSSISAGGSHTCGLAASGVAYCWGWNQLGQVGDGSTSSRNTPVAVSGGQSYSRLVAASAHTCAVTSAGTAYCWGRNGDGEVGDGSTTNRLMPVAVTGGLSFANVVGGLAYTCGWTTDGKAYCWGRNTQGQLGDGTTNAMRITPTAVVDP